MRNLQADTSPMDWPQVQGAPTVCPSGRHGFEPADPRARWGPDLRRWPAVTLCAAFALLAPSPALGQLEAVRRDSYRAPVGA
jgi:hypothetical protein